MEWFMNLRILILLLKSMVFYFFIYKTVTLKLNKNSRKSDKMVIVLLSLLFIVNLLVYYNITWTDMYGEKRYLPDIREDFIIITFLVLIYKENRIKTLYYAVYSYMLIELMALMISVISNLIIQGLFGVILSIEWVTCFDISQLVILFLMYIRIKKNAKIEYELEERDWRIFAFLAVLVCIYFFYFKVITEFFTIDDFYANLIEEYLRFGFMVAVYLIFNKYHQLLVKKNQSLLQTKLQLQSEQYQIQLREELLQANEENRKLRHDLKQHFSVLENTIRDDPEYALGYVKELWDHVETVKYAATGNDILNYVLDTKSAAASKHAVTFTYMIEDDLSFMNDFDLITILGNLLDNALEAQAFVEDKWVNMKIGRDRDIVNISVENACDQRRILRQGDCLETSKKDKECHGLGIKNVKECCEKYVAHLQLSIADNIFKATVTMMMQK